MYMYHNKLYLYAVQTYFLVNWVFPVFTNTMHHIFVVFSHPSSLVLCFYRHYNNIIIIIVMHDVF